mgnify:CR=1 FL=1
MQDLQSLIRSTDNATFMQILFKVQPNTKDGIITEVINNQKPQDLKNFIDTLLLKGYADSLKGVLWFIHPDKLYSLYGGIEGFVIEARKTQSYFIKSHVNNYNRIQYTEGKVDKLVYC